MFRPVQTAAVRGVGDFELSIPSDGSVRVALSGDWLLEGSHPSAEELAARLQRKPGLRQLSYETGELGRWDTGLINFLVKVETAARAAGLEIEKGGLPEGTRRLVELAVAVEEPEGARRVHRRQGFFERAGLVASGLFSELTNAIEFLGRLTLSLGRFVTGRANYQRQDLMVAIQEAGAEALGIVSLVSFLVGIILGFIGAVQFDQFGAGIYTANLVALAMTRVLGPIMTAVVLAGRTGAAYAAHLGSMKVSEEIDALRTIGLDPMDFLVLPRAVALVVMMPLLTLYSNVLGILGGMLVSVATLRGVTSQQYLGQTRAALGVNDLLSGLVMAAVFGVLVAQAGCQRGMESGKSAQAVGKAATSAVVTAIVLIVTACAVLTYVFTELGI